ncbi:MAG: DUF1700 domain-containing protein [Clostridiales bacterium]|nr:DUF1700 domain-containing protein [Clostridiales bacterium]
MNKETYLQELRKGLKILPQYDRDEAVEFYEEYFDEAGLENEAKVIEELGEPKILAKKILVDIVDRKYEESLASANISSENALATIPSQPAAAPDANAVAVVAPVVATGTTVEGQYAQAADAQFVAGAQPQAGYQNGAQYQQQAAAPQYQPQPQQKKETPSALKTLLIVLAAIFALPLSPVIFALLIVACVLIFVMFVVLIIFVAWGVGMLASGFVTIIFGIVALFMNPVAAMVILGGGLSCFGIGVFFTIGSVALIRLAAHGLAKGFSKIVHKKNRKNKAAQATA